MKSCIERLERLEQRQMDRLKIPVVIAALTPSGYEYHGKLYSETDFATFMAKMRPSTIIIDDIPKNDG